MKHRRLSERQKFAEQFNMSIDEICYWKTRYGEHKRTAIRRVDKNGDRIQFLLSFEQWMDLWIASGQLNNRGIKSGQYVMSRVNDIGDYAVGNVVIKLSTENTGEGMNGKFCNGLFGDSSWNKGVPCPNWVKERLSESRKGVSKSPEQVEKMKATCAAKKEAGIHTAAKGKPKNYVRTAEHSAKIVEARRLNKQKG